MKLKSIIWIIKKSKYKAIKFKKLFKSDDLGHKPQDFHFSFFFTSKS